MPTFFNFRRRFALDESQTLIIDSRNVPYVDSARIGALVGAYVTRQHSKRRLALVSVSNRVRGASKVIRVEQFFQFFDSVEAAQEN